MDRFDVLNLGILALFGLPVVARMTFWKRHGRLLAFRAVLPYLLLCVIGALTISLVHHWRVPHRHFYEWVLGGSALAVSLCKLVSVSQREKRKAR